jgi:hypothetical protein
MTDLKDQLNCQLDRAYLFILSTYPVNGVTELKVQNWSSRSEHEDSRQVQTMHDCYAVLHKVGIDVGSFLKQHTDLSCHEVADSAPTDQRLSQSRILVLQIPASELQNTELCRKVIDSVAHCSDTLGLETLENGSLLAFCNDSTLVLICSIEQLDSCLALVYSSIRLFETLRHKVLGQYAEYENEFRQSFLDSTAILQKDLQDLSQSWSNADRLGKLPPGDASRAYQRSHQLTQDYTIALLNHGPVKQIETMLAANLRNLDQIVLAFPEKKLPQVLQQQNALLQMLLAQVRADVQYAQPIVEASQTVIQSFHTEAIAELARAEAVENQQRAADSSQRDRLIQTLTLLGLWIGLNQVSNGWLSLPDPVKQWNIFYLLGCLALPTIVIGLIWLFFSLRSRRK